MDEGPAGKFFAILVLNEKETHIGEELKKLVLLGVLEKSSEPR